VKYFGVIADNGKRGFQSWDEAAKRHNLKIVSYLEDLDAVVVFGKLENLESFAQKETYSWEASNVKDYAFDTIEEAKEDVDMFIIHELFGVGEIIWKDIEE
jgi:hypothetical protein